MKKVTKKTAEEEAREKYEAAKKRWVEEHAETFLNTVKKTADEIGIELTPIQYVEAYKIGIEKLRFGYPIEFKIAELISTDENYNQVLMIMTEVMKRFRLAFHAEWRKSGQSGRRRKMK